MEKKKKKIVRTVTPEFRVSYPHLFTPQSIKTGDKPKFSVTGLFSKDTDLTELRKAIFRAKLKKFGPKEDWPEDLESPIKDGDKKKYADKQGYKDHYAIKFSTGEQFPPEVLGRDKKPLLKPSDLYPGCYAEAIVYAFGWEYAGKTGVSFTLDAVRKLRDGEAFGGRKPANQIFADLEPDEDDEDVVDDDESEDDEDFT